MYGGKVRIRFRPDGYSDILPMPADDGRAVSDHGRVATFEKVWGWDLEAASLSSSSSSSSTGRGGGLGAGGGGDPSPTSSSDFLLFSVDV